jgi:hypothetical protein
MSTHWIMTLPLAGIAYTLGAVGCAVWAAGKKTDKILWPLSGLIFSIAILNAYAETWSALKQLHFEYVVPILVVLFLLPYRSLCLRLIERTGLRAPLIKEMYSFLVLMYAGLIATMILSLVLAKDENPPFELFAFIAFVCALHVPTFAAGRSKVAKFVANSEIIVSKPTPDIPWRFFTTAMAILGIPLVLTLIVQAAIRDDYRLFTVDAVMTAIIFSLLAISRRGELKATTLQSQQTN